MTATQLCLISFLGFVWCFWSLLNEKRARAKYADTAAMLRNEGYNGLARAVEVSVSTAEIFMRLGIVGFGINLAVAVWEAM